jgi:hypothetical protein
MVSLVFDVLERVNPGETPAQYRPQRIAATINSYWQAIPLMRQTIEVSGYNVIAWLVYTSEAIIDHPGDCGSPFPIHHADDSWDHSPAVTRIATYLNNHPDEASTLAEMFPEFELKIGFYSRLVRKCWSGISVITEVD